MTIRNGHKGCLDLFSEFKSSINHQIRSVCGVDETWTKQFFKLNEKFCAHTGTKPTQVSDIRNSLVRVGCIMSKHTNLVFPAVFIHGFVSTAIQGRVIDDLFRAVGPVGLQSDGCQTYGSKLLYCRNMYCTRAQN